MAVSVIEEVKAPTRSITRRTFLRRSTLTPGTAALGLAGYSALIQADEVDVKKIELRVQRLAPAFDGFNIALLADLHFGPYTGKHEIGAAVSEANRLNPDAVALLGDFVSESLRGNNKEAARNAEPCA